MERFSAFEAHEMASDCKLNKTVLARWNQAIETIKKAASEGFFEVCLVLEGDLIDELKKLHFDMIFCDHEKHYVRSSIPKFVARQVVVSWEMQRKG